MYNLTDINHIKKLIKKFGFKFNKNLGQNFILGKNIVERMAKCCCNSETYVIEVGAGIGTLTCELAKNSKQVISFEIDSRLIPILNRNLAEFRNVRIIQNDILKSNIENVIFNEFPECKSITICANLPYYLTSEFIMKTLESDIKINSMVLMVQKEVAERVCASKFNNKKACGAITFAVKYFAESEILFNVSKEYFFPEPKVDSCVIKITPNSSKQVNVLSKQFFFNTVNFAFKQRRKNILNSLSSGFVSKVELKKVLYNLNLDFNLRAEDLGFDDYVDISNELYKLKNERNLVNDC